VSTVVVVTDDAGTRRAIAADLIALVPEVRVELADGAAAAEAVQRIRPDLVLGELAHAQALAGAPGCSPLAGAIPIIALTTDMRPDTLMEAEAAGIVAFVRMPADRRRLGFAIESILGGFLAR
jgi:CheY-like chemotaxis protein